MQAASLTLGLDADRLAQLEQAAAAQKCSVDAYILSILDRALQGEVDGASRGKTREKRTGAILVPDRAPLDAFLPEGADPFQREEAAGRELVSFVHQQAQLRFAGAPLTPPSRLEKE